MIVKDGNLVFENYYGNGNRSTQRSVFGVTVAVTSMVTGIALEEGLIEDLNDPISKYLPEFSSVFATDTLKRGITVGHLLTMKSGIGWNESVRSFADPRNKANIMSRSTDWAAYVLSQRNDALPGIRYGYNSGASILLSRIVSNVSGMTMEEYAASRLFGPLEISEWSWSGTTNGDTNSAWGLALNLVDMAKIGALMENDGEWNGQQLISLDWVNISTRNQVTINRFTDFGFYWWRLSDFNPYTDNLIFNDAFYGVGSGGQTLVVIPHLNMVVALHIDNYDEGLDNLGLEIVFNQIVPSLQSNPPTQP